MTALRLLLLIALLPPACRGTPAAADGPISFEVVKSGTTDGPPDAVRTVLRTEDTWRAFWARHGGTTPDIGELDFSQEMLVVVALGARPSAGYTVEVAEVVQEGRFVHVTAHETRPPSDGAAATVITTPYQVVRLPQRSAAVTIEVE
jgi:hypothetical protein